MTEPTLTAEREMQQRYRNVFGSPEGRMVLGDMLRLGYFFEAINPNDAAMNAEKNFVTVVARMAGLFDSLYPQLGLEVRKEQ